MMTTRRLWCFAIATATIAAAYVAYPYHTLHRLGAALESGDQPVLEQLVDWPSLREGIKGDLSALATRALARHTQPGGDPDAALQAGIAAVFMPMLVGQAVESQVTPAGIALLMRRQGRIETSEEGSAASDADWRFEVTSTGFTGPASFQFEFSNPDDPEPGPAVGIMELQGLSWRLTRLLLPIEGPVVPPG